MPFTAFQPSQHGFFFANTFTNETLIGPIKVTTTGRCGGMVYAALDYFTAGMEPPQTAVVPPDGDPLADYIMARQWQSLVDMMGPFVTKLAQQAVPRIKIPILGDNLGPGWSTEEQFLSGLDAFEGVRQSIDRGQPILLGLINIDFDVAGNHQVLAIGYDAGPDQSDRHIHVYDPNYPGEVTTLSADQGNNRFVQNNSCKVWRTLFTSDAYRPCEPPGVATRLASLTASQPSAFRTFLTYLGRGRTRRLGVRSGTRS